MKIVDFTSWIQLSATLNIAFVAIEYVKSYAKVIYDQVFNISNILETHFAPCIEILGDEETVNYLVPRTIGERSTSSQVEKVKREREKLTAKISASKAEILAETNSKCTTRSTSSLSLLVFFFSLFGLFLAGIEQEMCLYSHSIWMFLSVGVLIYLIFGWGLGERNMNCSILNFSSLWHPVIFAIGLLLISIITTLLCPTEWLLCVEMQLWKTILIASLLLMFLNFIIFISNIGIRAKQIRKSIKEKSTPIKCECETWKGQLNQLLNLEELHNGLNAD